MTIKVRIMFESANIQLGDRKRRQEISGLEVPYSAITLGDLTDRIAETEAHLSRITGVVVKIETGAE